MTLLSKQQVFAGALDKAYTIQMEKAGKANLVGQIIDKNPAVFKKKQKAQQQIILNRLGWIDVVEQMPQEISRMEKLVQDVKDDGIRHVFVLGMGGSSLCPEVFGDIFGRKSWMKSYTIVDTTAPSQLESIINSVDLSRSFFIVSSKSGSTIETMSQFRLFFKMVKSYRPLKAGQYFAAITDEGSDLHRIARRNRFREIFLNRSDIGGRYSALSYFGLVPAAFTNVNLTEVLDSAAQRLREMKENGRDCDALRLGVMMGVGASSGLDKLRFRTSQTVAPYINWIEQLVAESTGKDSRGVVPIEGNIDGGLVSEDLLDVYYWIKGEAPIDKPGAKIQNPGPYISIEMPQAVSLGGEILKWEMATAVASSVLGVNPFDEPNVAESKKNVAGILHSRRGPRKEIPIVPIAEIGDVAVVSISGVKKLERRRKMTPDEIFSEFFRDVAKGDYVTFLSYTERDASIENKLAQLRKLVESKYNLITMRGYGPRFLHSTGQLFKGGSQKGHFIVIEREYETDLDIPGKNISFGRLIKAQAKGDLKALQKRKRPVISLNLGLDHIGGLDQLISLIEKL